MFSITSTHRHSRNKCTDKVVVCPTVSTLAILPWDVTVCNVLRGPLGQKIKDMYLMAIT